MAEKIPQQVFRPLSPHIQIYKPQWTSVLSIMHRLTGIGLVLGFIGFVVFLSCAAAGEDSYGAFQGMIKSFFGKLLGLGTAAAFFYHMLNGLRHLCWDLGYGFEIQTTERSGKVVVLATLLFTCAFGSWLWF